MPAVHSLSHAKSKNLGSDRSATHTRPRAQRAGKGSSGRAIPVSGTAAAAAGWTGQSFRLAGERSSAAPASGDAYLRLQRLDLLLVDLAVSERLAVVVDAPAQQQPVGGVLGAVLVAQLYRGELCGQRSVPERGRHRYRIR